MLAKSTDQESIKGDIDVLAVILEQERRSHCRIRSLCFGLFMFSFAMLVCAMAVIGYMFINSVNGAADPESLMILQVLAPLSAAMIGFFASWCAAHNCINSIDRSLYAAQAQRYQLFAGFVGELQCASKKKRSMLMDIVGSVIA
ncbi:MAG: hypothetical protein Q8L84_13145 [Hyphomonas sp.]|jgi:hypothetical protein|nr:hypothetical protein [Hyphomonas sp.]